MTTICFGKPYSPIAKFQKPYSFGHTDSVKRMDDLVSCGLRKGGFKYEECLGNGSFTKG